MVDSLQRELSWTTDDLTSSTAMEQSSRTQTNLIGEIDTRARKTLYIKRLLLLFSHVLTYKITFTLMR